MIFCNSYFYKQTHPKFYQPVLDLMWEANNKSFLTKKDFDIFCDRLKRRLAMAKPVGHACSINVHYSGNGDGCIYLESGKLDDNIGRLFFTKFTEILEYDEEVENFYDVSERLDIEEGEA